MAANISRALLKDGDDFAIVLLSYYPNREEEGRALASAKIAELLKDYSKSTVTKGITKGYREAIYRAHYGHDFPGKSATEKQRADYYSAPVNWFTVPEEIKDEVNKVTQVNLQQQRTLTIVFPEPLIDALLEKAVNLVTRPPSSAYDYYAIGVGLELLTGRRQYREILTSAKFTSISKQYVKVENIGKTFLESVEIPVIGIDSETVCNSVELIRDFLSGRPWYYPEITSNEVKAKVDKITRDVIKKEFQPILDQYYRPLLDQYGAKWYEQFPAFSTHDLRTLYGVICYHRLNREASDIGVYVKSVLGHTSESSTKHYQKFKIKSVSDFEFWKVSIVPSHLS
jgi:hypothetical protein